MKAHSGIWVLGKVLIYGNSRSCFGAASPVELFSLTTGAFIGSYTESVGLYRSVQGFEEGREETGGECSGAGVE